MLRDSVVVVVVVRTRPRTMPLTMIAMRKSTHGFPFLSYMSMGLCLAAFRAARAPLSTCRASSRLSNQYENLFRCALTKQNPRRRGVTFYLVGCGEGVSWLVRPGALIKQNTI